MSTPVWYKAQVNEKLKVDRVTFKAGMMIYWTPSVTEGWVILFDGNKRYETITVAEAERVLNGFRPQSRAANSLSVDGAYMKAVMESA